MFVLVELRARFDEENIGGQAFSVLDAQYYMVRDLSIQSYCLHKEMNDKVEYITQIGTGNYNEKTAALYTDFSLMTAIQIGIEANRVFEASTGTLVEQSENLLVTTCLQNCA